MTLVQKIKNLTIFGLAGLALNSSPALPQERPLSPKEKEKLERLREALDDKPDLNAAWDFFEIFSPEDYTGLFGQKGQTLYQQDQQKALQALSIAYYSDNPKQHNLATYFLQKDAYFKGRAPLNFKGHLEDVLRQAQEEEQKLQKVNDKQFLSQLQDQALQTAQEFIDRKKKNIETLHQTADFYHNLAFASAPRPKRYTDEEIDQTRQQVLEVNQEVSEKLAELIQATDQKNWPQLFNSYLDWLSKQKQTLNLTLSVLEKSLQQTSFKVGQDHQWQEIKYQGELHYVRDDFAKDWEGIEELSKKVERIYQQIGPPQKRKVTEETPTEKELNLREITTTLNNTRVAFDKKFKAAQQFFKHQSPASFIVAFDNEETAQRQYLHSQEKALDTLLLGYYSNDPQYYPKAGSILKNDDYFQGRAPLNFEGRLEQIFTKLKKTTREAHNLYNFKRIHGRTGKFVQDTIDSINKKKGIAGISHELARWEMYSSVSLYTSPGSRNYTKKDIHRIKKILSKLEKIPGFIDNLDQAKNPQEIERVLQAYKQFGQEWEEMDSSKEMRSFLESQEKAFETNPNKNKDIWEKTEGYFLRKDFAEEWSKVKKLEGKIREEAPKIYDFTWHSIPTSEEKIIFQKDGLVIKSDLPEVRLEDFVRPYQERVRLDPRFLYVGGLHVKRTDKNKKIFGGDDFDVPAPLIDLRGEKIEITGNDINFHNFYILNGGGVHCHGDVSVYRCIFINNDEAVKMSSSKGGRLFLCTFLYNDQAVSLRNSRLTHEGNNLYVDNKNNRTLKRTKIGIKHNDAYADCGEEAFASFEPPYNLFPLEKIRKQDERKAMGAAIQPYIWKKESYPEREHKDGRIE